VVVSPWQFSANRFQSTFLSKHQKSKHWTRLKNNCATIPHINIGCSILSHFLNFKSHSHCRSCSHYSRTNSPMLWRHNVILMYVYLKWVVNSLCFDDTLWSLSFQTSVALKTPMFWWHNAFLRLSNSFDAQMTDFYSIWISMCWWHIDFFPRRFLTQTPNGTSILIQRFNFLLCRNGDWNCEQCLLWWINLLYLTK